MSAGGASDRIAQDSWLVVYMAGARLGHGKQTTHVKVDIQVSSARAAAYFVRDRHLAESVIRMRLVLRSCTNPILWTESLEETFFAPRLDLYPVG
jgi:hypothetical protein